MPPTEVVAVVQVDGRVRVFLLDIVGDIALERLLLNLARRGYETAVYCSDGKVRVPCNDVSRVDCIHPPLFLDWELDNLVRLACR